MSYYYVKCSSSVLRRNIQRSSANPGKLFPLKIGPSVALLQIMPLSITPDMPTGDTTLQAPYELLIYL